MLPLLDVRPRRAGAGVHARASSPRSRSRCATAPRARSSPPPPAIPTAPIARRRSIDGSRRRAARRVDAHRCSRPGSPTARVDRRAGARRHRARRRSRPRPVPPPTRRWPTIRFDGMQVRRDIGWRAPGADADVVRRRRRRHRRGQPGRRADEGAPSSAPTAPTVLRGVGSFGGAFSAKAIAAMDDPVLVASTDGVGTKVELAARLGPVPRRRRTTSSTTASTTCSCRRRGRCSSSTTSPPARSTPTSSPRSSTGMAEACEAAGCALLGGETAEMPGVYAPGAFDIAGTLVGVAERARPAPPRRRRAPATC